MCETRIFMHTFNLNSISQMKKKIFSALLMGVFTLASMSMFVSCKDYDDDINNLDAGQQELLSRIEALEGNVDQKLPEIESSLATAVENANKALQGVEDAQGLINEVKTTAEAAGAAATGAQEDADAAKAVADEALEKAEAALEALGVTEDGTSLVEKVNDLAEQLGTLQGIANNIPTLIEEAQKATKEELAKINEKVSKYEDLFDSLFAMLTNVELYGTFTGSTFNADALRALTMDMIYGNVGQDSKFGDNEAYINASPEVAYKKGAAIRNDGGVIVRVNPVNARIDGDNVAIKLINSKGEDMSAYIEATTVEPFNELITRSGATSKSGLYKVNFKFTDNADIQGFFNNVVAIVDKNKDGEIDEEEAKGSSVLFAVAINNTNDTANADRYVASTFDLALKGTEYKPTSDLSYSVTGTTGKKELDEIRNRVKERTGEAVDDNGKVVTNGPKEYTWKTSSLQNPTPATAMASDKSNVVEDADDRRSNKEYVPVEVGTPFTIALDNPDGKIDYYYVVLDRYYATESAPSEWNAWSGYTYTGLQTMTDADDKLNITINSASAVGDHIGFRLFAVNRDGTLVDPDGKAFYVNVGNASTSAPVNVEIHAWDNDHKTKGVTVKLPSDFKPAAGGTSSTGNGTIAQALFDKDGVKSDASAEFTWTLLDKDKKALTGNDWASAKYITIKMNDVQNFLDGATFSFVIENWEKTGGTTGDGGSTNRVINTLNVNVTKVMPTAELIDFTFKENQLVNGVYTCYLDASVPYDQTKWAGVYTEGVGTAGTQGYKNLWNFVSGIDESTDFIFTFANAAYDSKTKDYTANNVVKAAGARKYNLEVNASRIDGKTEHATTIERNYPKISYRYDADKKKNTKQDDFKVNVLTCKTVFACPIAATTYSWNQIPAEYKNGQLVTPAKDVNWIEYDAQAPNNVPSGGNIVDYLAATNTVDPVMYTTNKLWNITFYAKDAIGATGKYLVSAKLISNGTQKEDYFTVTVNADGTFTFKPQSGTTNPTADVASTLVITAKDIFGHTYEYKLPFTVKKRV